MKRCVLVVDFGTSNVRVQALDLENGEVLCSVSKKYRIRSIAKNRCEIDFEELWNHAEDCMAQTTKSLSYNHKLVALNFSYFGASIVPVNEEGEALDYGVLCFDSRSEKEAEEINKVLGEKLHTKITGGACDPNSFVARILWYKKHRQDLYDRTAYYWSVQEYILAKLGLFNVSDYTMASKSEILDDKRCAWSEEILKFLEIGKEKFSKVVSPDKCLGKIYRFGRVKLPNEVLVYPGLHDALAGFLGLGISGRTKVLAEVTGTFDHVGMITDFYFNCHEKHPEYNIWSSRSFEKNSSACIAYYPTSGALIEWFLGELAEGKTLEELWKDCLFNGDNMIKFSPDFQNGNGKIQKLGIGNTRTEIFEALIETLTFETRRCIEECEAISHKKYEMIRIGGGETKSDKWTQLRADITGKRFELPKEIECSALGVAIFTAVCMKIYDSFEEAVENMVKIEKVFLPNEQRHKKYENKYQEYMKKEYL
ncbi:hypothetical protein DWV97_08785 [Ruminococcus sp. AF14-10]|nr:hypothetical protein DWV97_08785 [Ruminococcus sp. AF14-10]